MDKLIAIINADLVRSSELDAEQRASIHRWLTGLPSFLGRHFGGGSEYLVDTFRGDSWQLLVPAPSGVLRVALYQQVWLRANIIGFHARARQGIGIGRQQFTEPIDLASADGPAFRRAGQALEASYQGSLLQLIGPEDLAGYPQESLEVMLALIDEFSTGWTEKQAQAVLGAIIGRTQEQIGESWPKGPISQQAVGQHLQRSGWNTIESVLDFFESWLPQLLASPGSNQS